MSFVDVKDQELASISIFCPHLEKLKLNLCGRLDDDVLDQWENGLEELRELDLYGEFCFFLSLVFFFLPLYIVEARLGRKEKGANENLDLEYSTLFGYRKQMERIFRKEERKRIRIFKFQIENVFPIQRNLVSCSSSTQSKLDLFEII